MLTASIIILLLTVVVAINDVDSWDYDDPILLNGILVQPERQQPQPRLRLP